MGGTMTDKWDNLKHKIEHFANTAADKASEFTKEAADKAEKLTRQSKIKLDIFQLEKSKDKQYLKLGKLVYKNIQNETEINFWKQSEVQHIYEIIEKIDADIEIKKEKLNVINKQKTDESKQEKS